MRTCIKYKGNVMKQTTPAAARYLWQNQYEQLTPGNTVTSYYNGAFGKPVNTTEIVYKRLKKYKKTAVRPMLNFVQRRSWPIINKSAKNF